MIAALPAGWVFATAGAGAFFAAGFCAEVFRGLRLVTGLDFGAVFSLFFGTASLGCVRCDLETDFDLGTDAERDGLAAVTLRAGGFGAFLAELLAAGALTGLAAGLMTFRGGVFFNATGFFDAGFLTTPALAAPAFFFVTGTVLRLEIAIFLTIVARRPRVIA